MIFEYKIWAELTDVEKKELLTRPVLSVNADLKETVKTIVENVKTDGDSSLKKYTSQFDSVSLDEIKVSKDEILEAYTEVTEEFVESLKVSISNVRKFHAAQAREELNVEIVEGVNCKRIYRPIENVGLYVPGGTAPLPSTVVMLGVPAILAGCKNIILCSPPTNGGRIDPSILVAAKEVGITEIYSVGGAQAIAALAYGTESIPKVDKIFGPGNAWVTEAKQQVASDFEGASLDMPAGPSEVLVVADEKANPEFVAADLLSQAEHGSDSQVVLVSESAIKIEQVFSSIVEQIELLPRKEIVAQSLKNARFILTESIDDSIEVSNQYGPEHLIIQTENLEDQVAKIESAGSIFLGPYSPESVGDYASGTNHVLPTYGFAKSYSGVSLDSYMKAITVQKLSKEGLQTIGPAVEVLAKTEKLDAHKNAVSIRLAYIESLGEK
jgi:histidinol dehydrogenase